MRGGWEGGGGGSAVAAADYPPIRHKNNFLIYEESSRVGLPGAALASLTALERSHALTRPYRLVLCRKFKLPDCRKETKKYSCMQHVLYQLRETYVPIREVHFICMLRKCREIFRLLKIVARLPKPVLKNPNTQFCVFLF